MNDSHRLYKRVKKITKLLRTIAVLLFFAVFIYGLVRGLIASCTP